MTKQMIKDIMKRPIDWSQKEYKTCGDVIQKILGSAEHDNIEILMEELEKIIDTPREWLEKQSYCKEDIAAIEDNQKEARLLLKEIKNYISNVCHVRTNLDDGKEALRPIIELRKKHRFKIFTTNYDNNIEDTCKDLGIEYSTGIDVDENNKKYFSPVFFDDERLGIYKLHGSVYWYRNKDAPGTLIDLDAPDLSGKTIEDAMIYPGRKKELLSYPYSVLFRLFDHAMEGLDKLVVIGHRFEDEHIMEMIERRVGKNNFELIIVNPSPNESERIIELSKKPGVKVISKSIQDWTKDESFRNLSEEMKPIPEKKPILTKKPKITKNEKILISVLVASIALVIVFASLSYEFDEKINFLIETHTIEITKNEFDIIKKAIKDDIRKSFEISVDLGNDAFKDYNQNFMSNGTSTGDYLSNTLSKKYENISPFQKQSDTVIHLDPIHYGILAAQNDDGSCKYIIYPYEDKMIINGGSEIPPQQWCPRSPEPKAEPIMTEVLHSYGGEDFAVDVGMRFDLNGDDEPDGYHLMGMTRGKMCSEIKDYDMKHQFVLVSNSMQIIFDTGKDEKCDKIDAYNDKGEFDGKAFGDMSPGLFDKSDYSTLSDMEEKIRLSDFKAIHGHDIQENKDVSWTLYMYKK